MRSIKNSPLYPAPLTVGIYTFTTDDGQLRYINFGLDANAVGDNTDLGWIRIEIAPSAQVTQFGLFVGLAGPQQHNREAVLFFDNHNDLLGGTGVSLDGGFSFVGFEATSGFIGSVIIQDVDPNGSVFTVDNLEAVSRRNIVDAVPGPIAGAGLPGLILAGGGAWWRRRRGGLTRTLAGRTVAP